MLMYRKLKAILVLSILLDHTAFAASHLDDKERAAAGALVASNAPEIPSARGAGVSSSASNAPEEPRAAAGAGASSRAPTKKGFGSGLGVGLRKAFGSGTDGKPRAAAGAGSTGSGGGSSAGGVYTGNSCEEGSAAAGAGSTGSGGASSAGKVYTGNVCEALPAAAGTGEARVSAETDLGVMLRRVEALTLSSSMEDQKMGFDYIKDIANSTSGDPALIRKARMTLPILYAKGIGVREDKKQAVQLLEPFLSEGDRDAESLMGCLYLEGWEGVPVNYEKAVEYFRKAAEKGDDTVMYKLARLEQKGWPGHAPNLEVAMEWCIKAARKGNVDAIEKLVNMGLRSGFARKVLRELAAMRIPAAIYGLGCLEQHGWEGYPPQLALSRELFVEAAKRGYGPAIDALIEAVAAHPQDVDNFGMIGLIRLVQGGNGPIMEALKGAVLANKPVGVREALKGAGITLLSLTSPSS